MKNKFKPIKMNKKADAAATITWFGAFIIIFFIMLLFVSATAAFTGKKYLLNMVIPGQQGLNLVPEQTALTSSRVVNSVLDEKINEVSENENSNSKTIREALLQLAYLEGEYEKENFPDRKEELRKKSDTFREEVKTAIENFFKNYNKNDKSDDKCYVFYVNYNKAWSDPNKPLYSSGGANPGLTPRGESSLNNEKTITVASKNNGKEFSINKITYTLFKIEPLTFYSGNEYVKIKYYTGEC